MSEAERLADWTPQRVIEFIADRSIPFAFQAGVGAMETAGGLVSYLARHPNDIEPFLNHGISELPEDWYQRGCLTWHAMNGKIVHPDYARRARIIQRLEKDAQA